MSDSHLGDTVHDLLDNRLSAAQAAEAMRHLDACEQCRARWNELRAARDALKTSDAGIDMRFAQQLLDRDRMAQIASSETRHQARAARPRDRRPMLVAAVAVAVVTLVVGAGYVAGEPEEVALEFADDSRGSTAVMQVGAPAMRAGDGLRSWVHPDWEATGLVPVEATVLRLGSGENVLVASMLADLEPIVITQQHGRLSPAIAEYYAAVDLGQATAYAVSERPRRLVWQTGDVVISVTCTCPQQTLESAASTFPAQGAPTIVDRVLGGLDEISDFVTP